MPRVLAAADIGSNTAHLLVADVQAGKVKRLANVSEWLSLGEVVSREGHLPTEVVDQLVPTVAAFCMVAEEKRSERLYFFATEAMRAASNHDEVLRLIERKTGVAVEVVSPQREAELTLLGVRADCAGESPFVVVELGGGSVQVALCNGPGLVQDVSLPIGTGALIAQAALGQPAAESAVEEVRRTVELAVSSLGPTWSTRRMVLAGGVARGIWRALHPDGERTLHVRELDHLAWGSARLSLGQLVGRYRVKPKRAQTLLPGSVAYGALMRWAGHDWARVSEYGVREGAVLEMAKRNGA